MEHIARRHIFSVLLVGKASSFIGRYYCQYPEGLCRSILKLYNFESIFPLLSVGLEIVEST